MTNTMKYIGCVIAGVIVGLLFSVVGGNSFGGVYNQVSNTFREGLTAGTSDQFSVSSAGNITTSGTATFSSGLASFVSSVFSSSVSVATTSTSRMINAGAGGSATTTIDLGKPCFRMTVGETSKTVVYYWPSLLTGTNSGWATSTVSCF